jgi:hypothetical protein
MMSAPDGMRYCVYDPARKAGTWAAVGEQGNPFLIVSARPDLNQATLDVNGRVITLELRESRVVAAPPLTGTVQAVAQPEVVVHSGRGRQPGDVRAPVLNALR